MPSHRPPSQAVVLVSSDSSEIKLLARAFRGREETLVLADDAAQLLDYFAAIEQDRAPSPALVILSAQLSPPGALELLKRVRSRRRMRDLPVVMLVSERPAWDVARAHASGMSSYVRCARDPEGFVRQVEQVAHSWLDFDAARSRPQQLPALDQMRPLDAPAAPGVVF